MRNACGHASTGRVIVCMCYKILYVWFLCLVSFFLTWYQLNHQQSCPDSKVYYLFIMVSFNYAAKEQEIYHWGSRNMFQGQLFFFMPLHSIHLHKSQAERLVTDLSFSKPPYLLSPADIFSTWFITLVIKFSLRTSAELVTKQQTELLEIPVHDCTPNLA